MSFLAYFFRALTWEKNKKNDKKYIYRFGVKVLRLS